MQNFNEKNNELISMFLDPSVMETFSMLIEKDDVADVLSDFCVIAEIFGSRKDFEVLVLSNAEQKVQSEEKLIHSFCNNLNLLVQKTWIEKSDEAFKEQVINRIELFCEEIKNQPYAASLSSFLAIVQDVVYLMFGNQVKKTEEFPEYALRIDPGFGIFWWYITSLPKEIQWNEEKSRCFLLLAMFFLANY